MRPRLEGVGRHPNDPAELTVIARRAPYQACYLSAVGCVGKAKLGDLLCDDPPSKNGILRHVQGCRDDSGHFRAWG